MAHNGERVPITVRPECFIAVSLSLLLIRWRWVVAWIVAATVHELFHFFAIRLSGGTVWQVEIGLNGTTMNTQLERPWMELICAIAGPAGSVCLGLFAGSIPRIAVCGYIQFLFNLLPIYPNDGGRVLKVLLERWMSPKTTAGFLSLLNNAICALSLVGSVYVSIRYSISIIPVLIALVLCVRIKKPCKQRRIRVQ